MGGVLALASLAFGIIGLLTARSEDAARVHADNWVFAGCPHAGPALQAKLEIEIRNWTRFIDAKGIKAE